MFAAIPERRAGLSVVANSDTGTLLTLEALMSWLAETGALAAPQRAALDGKSRRKCRDRIGIAAAGRSIFARSTSTRWPAAVAVLAGLAVASDTRLLDRRGMGPIPLGRLVHPAFPTALAVAAAVEGTALVAAATHARRR